MRLIYCAVLFVAFLTMSLSWGFRLAAQDTILSHWPIVRQTPVDPAKRNILVPLVEALLARPTLRTPELPEHAADGNSSGWQNFEQARQNLRQRDFTAAAQCAEKALAAARTSGDKRLEMRALDLIGGVSREVFLGASLKAAPYHEEALALARALRDSVYMVRELLALADNYGQAGQNAQFLEYATRAAQVLAAFDVPLQRIRLGVLTGGFLASQGDLERAEKIFRSALQLARSRGSMEFVQHLYWQLFEVYLGLGDAVQAQVALDSVRAFDPEIPTVALQEPLYKLEKLQGNRAKAFGHLEQAYRFLGEEYSRRSAEQLAGWEARLRTQEKEIQLDAQKQLLAEQKKMSHYLYGLIALVSILLFVSLIAWYRQRRSKHLLFQQNQLIEQQSDELKQIDRLKSRFFANVSHELRTPLTLILGPLGQALNDKRLAPDLTRLLQAAQRNAGHVLGLVNEILDLSKIGAVKPGMKEQPTVLFDFLDETIHGFQPLAEARNIDLHLEYAPDHAWTLALDRDKFLKILHNLLSNALKFTPAGGQVVLSVTPGPASFRLAVRDTGPGIHPMDLPHIFDLYFQSKRPDAKAEGGTGIGLTLSRELAGVMGGSLHVESQLGQGSTFFLTLPARELVPTEAQPISPGRRYTGLIIPARTAPPPSAPAAAPANAPQLLLVEDNADLQDFLRGILEADYQLNIVNNGQEALDYLKQARQAPDLILSDLMMPVLDGFQLIETLRNNDPWRAIPVILLTARAERDDRLRAFRTGIDDYVVKPFVPEELLVRIDNALRNQAARREWAEILDEAGKEPFPDTVDTWTEQLERCIRENLNDFHFNVDYLAELMGTNRKSLYRKIRAITGLSVNQYIQEIRLQKARELLEVGAAENLRTVAEAVGFRTTDYFSRLYRERFGRSPAEHL